MIHPAVAERLGVVEGEWVHISTRRGRITQKVRLDEYLDPRVIEVDYAWWFPEKGPGTLYGWEESNVNLLTDNKPPFSREMGSPNMRGIFCRVDKD